MEKHDINYTYYSSMVVLCYGGEKTVRFGYVRAVISVNGNLVIVREPPSTVLWVNLR